MRRKMAIVVFAVVALSTITGARADHGSPAFETGSCAPNGVLPGSSGNVIVVEPGSPTALADGIASASEGDTVFVRNGEYAEAVTVTTPGLRIVGESRNGVRLNGGNTLDVGVQVLVDRVLVENMSAHNYKRHGFYWGKAYGGDLQLYPGVTGYWGRYLNAWNNGLYGVYAFSARCGQLDNLYGWGNADSAFYIGECFPCDAVIAEVEAERNALGYSGTNAGGNLTLRDSYWHNNGLGIVPNSLDGEERPPQRGAIIRNNRVENNNDKFAPGVGLAGTYYGGGIVIAGGSSNEVYGNTVTGHELAGIVLAPLPDQNVWISSGNTIWGNTVSGLEGSLDLAQSASSGANNCWADNDFATAAPAVLEDVWSCAFTATPPGGDPRVEVNLLEGPTGLNGRAPADWRTFPAPAIDDTRMPSLPDENGNGDYTDDGAPDEWLPALGMKL